VTRLLEGLEAAGLVEKVACETDLRVSYAQLTGAGFEKLEHASCGHTGSVRSILEERLSGDEIEQLAELLAKLPGALDESQPCSTDA
jgi:DNA-binding MarR family transcriptional regulator